MNKQEIAIRYRNSICPSNADKSNIQTINPNIGLSVQAEVMNLGFILTEQSIDFIHFAKTDFIDNLINTLKYLKGDHVVHETFYPNFPQQVMDAHDYELFMNALLHYWTVGEWRPDFVKEARSFHIENVKFKHIDMINDYEFLKIYTSILSSKDSISQTDREVVEWFHNNYDIHVLKSHIPEDIPFKEVLCLVASHFISQGINVSNMVKNATDVLRIATYMSDGDVSLGTNTKFKSFPKKTRRMFCKMLEDVATLEDIARHRGKWTRLFHVLHVGDFSDEVYKQAKYVRENKHIPTFNTTIEKWLKDGCYFYASKKLKDRPGEFVKRLDHILREVEYLTTEKVVDMVLNQFEEVVPQIPTKSLMSLCGNLKGRMYGEEKRIVFPKGKTQKAVIVDRERRPISKKTILKVIAIVQKELIDRFSYMDELGSVWIDPRLKECPLPTQMRSASDSLYRVARGTKIPFETENNTLRFFVYWKGFDIDLSGTFYSEDFSKEEQISYTHLRDQNMGVYHSGDVRNAPNGASEFIDVDIEKTLKSGYRYVGMNVFVYSGGNFSEHEECFAGWMTREKPNSNEIYDPKTVEQKVDLRSDSKNVIAAVFDLKERKMIWVDVVYKESRYFFGNNVESNKASIVDIIESFVTLTDRRVSLYDLFYLHAKARGTITDNVDEADTVFSLDGGITPFDIDRINSDFL